ncbi:hypothetical protein P5V15_014355 [Pogonomyrmex californicus]
MRPRIILTLTDNIPASSFEAGGRENETWSEVVRRSMRKRLGGDAVGRRNIQANRATIGNNSMYFKDFQCTPRPRNSERNKSRAASPNVATISIIVENTASYVCVSILSKVREAIPLEEFDVLDTKVKRALSGGVLLELRGNNSSIKADLIMERMKNVFNDSKVNISKPIRTADVRLIGFDDSVSSLEI